MRYYARICMCANCTILQVLNRYFTRAIVEFQDNKFELEWINTDRMDFTLAVVF